ncbi:acyl-CoA dehydrogenase family protein [Actinomadura barringtoniae]|uniref:Acyl-CoA dehydrogenase family protein n=1 Tax=Actinomadura barringtoniae TaxID=1427535 RepID=A0A939T4M1_9ACTN|nr:acyl-CoA dehydrogenase family protein [Actinomadura barringtoniae]MBO2449573.1 acyl-CoA dehydrogenase family protein [Actinomadura barringtoniae]
MASGEELIDRARVLAATLADRAREAEELRRPPDETIADLAAAGFLETLVPKARGGLELDLATLSGISRELGAGCASTGWISAIYMLHNWLIALYPQKAQDEVFAGRPYAFIPCTLAPVGRAEVADGGYRVTGRWSWGTGVMHADWVMVSAMSNAGPLVCLLPAAEAVVHDVWFTSGMRGTGSNDIEVPDRFVPGHRCVPLLDLARGSTPGRDLHDGPAYRWPLVPVLALAGASPILGAAEGLLVTFKERLRERVLAYSGVKQVDRVPAQMRLAKATAELAGARLLLDDAIAALQRTYEGGGRYTLADRARSRLVGAQVVTTARNVVNDLCLAAGASAQFEHMPFQRVQRDLATISGHIVYDLDETYAMFGRVDLGLELDAATLV